MPEWTCYCGEGFFLSHRRTPELMVVADRFCSPECLLKFIRELPDATDKIDRDYLYLTSILPQAQQYWDDALSTWFRSSSESAVARFFHKNHIVWYYEHYALELDGMAGYTPKDYTPDFYIHRKDLFVEVKGKWGFASKQKFRQALLSNHSIILIPDYLVRLIKKEIGMRVRKIK